MGINPIDTSRLGRWMFGRVSVGLCKPEAVRYVKQTYKRDTKNARAHGVNSTAAADLPLGDEVNEGLAELSHRKNRRILRRKRLDKQSVFIEVLQFQTLNEQDLTL